MTVALSTPAPLTHLNPERAFVHAYALALAERSDPATQAARLHAVASALHHLLNRRWANVLEAEPPTARSRTTCLWSGARPVLRRALDRA